MNYEKYKQNIGWRRLIRNVKISSEVIAFYLGVMLLTAAIRNSTKSATDGATFTLNLLHHYLGIWIILNSVNRLKGFDDNWECVDIQN